MYTADKETGTFIEWVNTIEEGISFIEQYEREDMENGIFEGGFYDIVDCEHRSVLI